VGISETYNASLYSTISEIPNESGSRVTDSVAHKLEEKADTGEEQQELNKNAVKADTNRTANNRGYFIFLPHKINRSNLN